jgi:hypothetical protein
VASTSIGGAIRKWQFLLSFGKHANQASIQRVDEDGRCDGHSPPSSAAESDHWSSDVVLNIGRPDVYYTGVPS